MKTDPLTLKSKLNTESLAVGYNKKALISDISLSFVPGEIVTLIGPNGSGKTTILKSITKHLSLISGSVFIDGKNMSVMSGKDIAVKMAVVLTDRIIPEMMTCREMVSAGRYPYTNSFGILTEHDKEIVERSLETVNALDIADRDYSTLSDGQRQKILLARAICQEPEVIVLDEPTSYLDIKHKIELLEILRSMAKEQSIAVIMSMHEIDLACKISDKIICVKGDRIAAYGTPDEIFTDENIASLYGMERGLFNTLLGSAELSKVRGDIRCFVIGGNGYGIPYYRLLQKKGVPFAAGILFENDIDHAVAVSLAEKTVSAEPFVPVDYALVEKSKRIIDLCRAVIDCGCPVKEFNAANGELMEYARDTGKKIISSLTELSGVSL